MEGGQKKGRKEGNRFFVTLASPLWIQRKGGEKENFIDVFDCHKFEFQGERKKKRRGGRTARQSRRLFLSIRRQTKKKK